MKNTGAAMSRPATSILLIDDNTDGLCVRKAMLEQSGFHISTASNPEEGLRRFAEGQFDLLITDFSMPGMTGIEVIRHVRSANPALPIILISGHVDSHGLTEENTGADAVIAKRANEEPHLLRAVNRLLRRKAPRKPPRSQSGGSARKRLG